MTIGSSASGPSPPSSSGSGAMALSSLASTRTASTPAQRNSDSAASDWSQPRPVAVCTSHVATPHFAQNRSHHVTCRTFPPKKWPGTTRRRARAYTVTPSRSSSTPVLRWFSVKVGTGLTGTVPLSPSGWVSHARIRRPTRNAPPPFPRHRPCRACGGYACLHKELEHPPERKRE